jgi:hypothetical protein
MANAGIGAMVVYMLTASMRGSGFSGWTWLVVGHPVLPSFRCEKLRHGLDDEIRFHLTRLLLPDAVRRVFHEARKIPE